MLTREQIKNKYKVDKRGIIQTPGMFEGEMLYVPYFCMLLLDGDDDFVFDGEWVTDILDEDKAMFPELRGYKEIILTMDCFGFVNAIVEKDEDYEVEAELYAEAEKTKAYVDPFATEGRNYGL